MTHGLRALRTGKNEVEPPPIKVGGYFYTQKRRENGGNYK